MVLKTYFFVPANNNSFIKKTYSIPEIDHRIFDIEDSILENEIIESFKNLSSVELFDSDYIRIPILWGELVNIIIKCKNLNLHNYIIPKVNGYKEFKRLINILIERDPDAKVILLVETPKTYMDLEGILIEFGKYIKGISLGIQDFSFYTGIKNKKLISNLATNILILAQSYEIEAIDVVSMNIGNKNELKEDYIKSFNNGYRAKFFIHPYQLKILMLTPFYSEKEVKENINILKYYNDKIDKRNAVFSYNGRVYEKMHVSEIKEIVEWGTEFYGTNRKVF